MKKRIRQQLSKPAYSVRSRYWDTGKCQFIARHQYFEAVTMAVIFLNSIWIWIDTDYNNEDSLAHAGAGFIIVEQAFCFFFTAELLVRWFAFRRKRNALRDHWFLFDFCLVILMVSETWILTVLIYVLGDGLRDAGGIFENFSILKACRLLRLLECAGWRGCCAQCQRYRY